MVGFKLLRILDNHLLVLQLPGQCLDSALEFDIRPLLFDLVLLLSSQLLFGVRVILLYVIQLAANEGVLSPQLTIPILEVLVA